jgi:prepilin-type N-terminal cleavage/methylation domain-containing protein
MKNKGFTLVELLAVIVILAVIALISTPQVLSMIESSRQGAAESSALSYINTIEQKIIVKLMNASATANYNQTFIIDGLVLTNVVDANASTLVARKPCINKSSGVEEVYPSNSDGVCNSSTQNVNSNYLTFSVELKGGHPATDETSYVVIKNNVVSEAYIKFNNYRVSYFYDYTSGDTVYCSTTGDTFLTKAGCASAS